MFSISFHNRKKSDILFSLKKHVIIFDYLNARNYKTYFSNIFISKGSFLIFYVPLCITHFLGAVEYKAKRPNIPY